MEGVEKLVVLLCDECASGYAGFAESVEGRDRGEEEEGEDPTFCGVDEVAVYRWMRCVWRV